MYIGRGDEIKIKRNNNNILVDLHQDESSYQNHNDKVYQNYNEQSYRSQQQHDNHNYSDYQQEQQMIDNENKSQQNDNHIDRLKEQLITLYQQRTLNKILKKLQQKIFWIKFNAFSSIKIITYKTSNKNKIINIIDFIVTKNNHHLQLKSFAFNHIKSIYQNKKHINQLKTSFFIKYYINPTYINLSLAFSQIKSTSLSLKNQTKNINKTTKSTPKLNDQRLIKFQKQSKKFRLKQITVTLRNFINKKYLKPTLNHIKLYTHFKSTHHFQQKHTQTQNIIINPNNQSKDARFIKKKIQPHKIIQEVSTKRTYIQPNTLTLQKINLGNYQIQKIKRRQFQSLHLITVLIQRKIMTLYSFAFSLIHPTYQKQQNQLQGKQSHNQTQQINVKKVQQDSQVSIMRNVMKNMCYVSSKVSKKRQKKIMIQRQKASIRIIAGILQRNLKKITSIGFYCVKMQMMRQNMLILQRIRQLQEVKRECLQYFNNSMMDQGQQ